MSKISDRRTYVVLGVLLVGIGAGRVWGVGWGSIVTGLLILVCVFVDRLVSEFEFDPTENT